MSFTKPFLEAVQTLPQEEKQTEVYNVKKKKGKEIRLLIQQTFKKYLLKGTYILGYFYLGAARNDGKKKSSSLEIYCFVHMEVLI